MKENEFEAPREKIESGAEGKLQDTAYAIGREAKMISLGVGYAVKDTLENPQSKLNELATSAAVGTGLGIMSRLGAPGRVIAMGTGMAMTTKFAYDELTGQRWSKFGTAVKDTWQSGENMQENIAVTRDSLGSFLVDTGIGLAAKGLSNRVTARLAPPSLLVDYAIRKADSDGGKALLALQNRWEKTYNLSNYRNGKLQISGFTQSAVPGQARGDLLRVGKTPDGKVILSAMDVEGHGVGAAKKAVTVHAAMDAVLPKAKGKDASEILTLVDKKLDASDERAITAALSTFDPVTNKLDTATASSQFAFLIRKSGRVHQLDAKGGGLGLGNDMYSLMKPGHEVVRLNHGDTVVMASDGVYDRFGYGNLRAFKNFLRSVGPNPDKLRRLILNKPVAETGADDTSFLIFSRL
ncbi:MAG: serine/threonine-protein phosphatase [Candidatus Obscuribacter sp.]|nr:serine/threonine-protein phosphatase [Candidatus Obscuribacter sp.]MBL8080986.1 serine/threonine-protein phosphatase [Candidatus Obscuribacter sp.]